MLLYIFYLFLSYNYLFYTPWCCPHPWCHCEDDDLKSSVFTQRKEPSHARRLTHRCLVPVFITALLIVLVSALNLHSRHRRRKETFGIDANPLDIWNWRETLFHLWAYSTWLPHSLLTHLLPVNECYIASHSNWHTFHLHDFINKSLVQDEIVAISLTSTPGHPQDRTALTFLYLPSSWHQQTFHLYLS